MGEVLKFPPKQKKPCCPGCAKELPSFAGMNLIVPPGGFGDFKLVGVKIQLRCPCGAEFDAGQRQ